MRVVMPQGPADSLRDLQQKEKPWHMWVVPNYNSRRSFHGQEEFYRIATELKSWPHSDTKRREGSYKKARATMPYCWETRLY
jgi:hypothetical protein